MRARFYLIKKLLDSEGAAPIYINIHHRSHRLRYYTGERIKQDDWSREKQRAKSSYIGHASLNNLLNVLAEEPRTIERNARIHGIDCTVEYLKEKLSYNRPKYKDLIGLIDVFIKEECERNQWSRGDEKKWWFFRNNLSRFDREFHLEFSSINVRFAHAFINFMVKHGYEDVMIENHLHMTIQFVEWARQKGYHTSKSHRGIDVMIHSQKPENDDVYLTIEEIARVNQLSFKENESRYEKARDVFLFSCLTGLRYADLKKLRRYSIKYNYLVITSENIEENVRVPLLDIAMDILEKYKEVADTHPIPIISQQKYNEYLKEIGKRAALNEKIIQIQYKGRERIESSKPKWQLLTSHAGRKTFVAMAIFFDIPIETVCKITGYKSDSISAYYDIPDARKELEIQKFKKLRIT